MAKRTDANQQEIIDALRQLGVSVQSLHAVGSGVPDLLAGYRGRNYLLEVKMPDGKLNDKQAEWHTDWRGDTYVVRTVEDAIHVVTCGS